MLLRRGSSWAWVILSTDSHDHAGPRNWELRTAFRRVNLGPPNWQVDLALAHFDDLKSPKLREN